MRLTPWMHSLDSTSVARLLALRPDAISPGPASLPHLARQLSTLASVPPPRHTWQDRYRPVPPQERLPAEELYDLGLLFVASGHGHAILPREIALVVQGPEWRTPWPMRRAGDCSS